KGHSKKLAIALASRQNVFDRSQKRRRHRQSNPSNHNLSKSAMPSRQKKPRRRSRSKMSRSLSRTVVSQKSLDNSADKLAFLNQFLPPEWQTYFNTVKAGKYLGLVIECNECGAKPPSHLKYGSRKWRWLAVHIM